MKKIIALALTLVSAVIPGIAAAQSSTLTNINDIFARATSLGNAITILLVSFAVIWIIYSTVRYLIAGDDSEKRTAGGWSIFWGVVGLFVILSIWGLVNILRNSFRTQNINPQGAIPTALPPSIVN